jgi:hypothetical protein
MLMQEELNAFNRSEVKEWCVIIIDKIVCIDQTIGIHFAGIATVNTDCVEH